MMQLGLLSWQCSCGLGYDDWYMNANSSVHVQRWQGIIMRTFDYVDIARIDFAVPLLKLIWSINLVKFD